MTTKAQVQFKQILSEIDLTQFTRQVYEFKLLTKSALNDMWKAFTGSYGGIKIVVHDDNKVPAITTLIIVFHDNGRIGTWHEGRFYGLVNTKDLVSYINDFDTFKFKL